MRTIGSLFPDPVHLLASLCELSRSQPVPFIAAAVGSHPIRWQPLSPGDLPGQRWRAPAGSYAIGVIGGGTTQSGDEVLVAFVIDRTDRHRTVIYRGGDIIDTAFAVGPLLDDCRDALGLDAAA